MLESEFKTRVALFENKKESVQRIKQQEQPIMEEEIQLDPSTKVIANEEPKKKKKKKKKGSKNDEFIEEEEKNHIIDTKNKIDLTTKIE